MLHGWDGQVAVQPLPIKKRASREKNEEGTSRKRETKKEGKYNHISQGKPLTLFFINFSVALQGTSIDRMP